MDVKEVIVRLHREIAELEDSLSRKRAALIELGAETPRNGAVKEDAKRPWGDRIDAVLSTARWMSTANVTDALRARGETFEGMKMRPEVLVLQTLRRGIRKGTYPSWTVKKHANKLLWKKKEGGAAS